MKNNNDTNNLRVIMGHDIAVLGINIYSSMNCFANYCKGFVDYERDLLYCYFNLGVKLTFFM